MYKTMNINEAIRENKGLIYEVINRYYYNKKYDFVRDDLFQVGQLSLYKAIQTFDESKNIKFSTFAMTVIKNDLLKFATRDYEKYSGVINDTETSLNSTIGNDDDMNMEDRLGIEEDFSELEGSELLSYIRERKSEKVVKMVMMLSEGYTYEEVGKKLGCSKQYVNSTMKKLAEELSRSSFMAYQIIKRKFSLYFLKNISKKC